MFRSSAFYVKKVSSKMTIWKHESGSVKTIINFWFFLSGMPKSLTCNKKCKKLYINQLKKDFQSALSSANFQSRLIEMDWIYLLRSKHTLTSTWKECHKNLSSPTYGIKLIQRMHFYAEFGTFCNMLISKPQSSSLQSGKTWISYVLLL